MTLANEKIKWNCAVLATMWVNLAGKDVRSMKENNLVWFLYVKKIKLFSFSSGLCGKGLIRTSLQYNYTIPNTVGRRTQSVLN